MPQVQPKRRKRNHMFFNYLLILNPSNSISITFFFFQNEIHMSEEVIQDILEQTESDPAFQALFDLFDYGKETISFKAVQRKMFLLFLW